MIAAFLLLIVCVLVRVRLLKSLGIDAFRFGKMDKKDFIIPPFALVFLYLLIANVWDFPRFDGLLFRNGILAWVGVVSCFLGLALFVWALVSFGKSFRVGIDEDSPGSLVTTGAFALSRNPIYVAFFFVLLGILLVYPTVVFLVYLLLASFLFTRQIKLEESSLQKVYGTEFDDYCKKVRRFL
ncbi:MAG: isoprenylcysteine carboxylmethyltransferase family protein [Coriobacteriia bacterium]|nr:isoprenylcysteine carboxylmethyltransferase family protein [Coriobacteriia bacterium]